MTQRPRATPAPAPWWIAGGDEECPHCGQRYHLEVERRCAACDAPSCPHCLAADSGVCPDCTQEPQR